MYRCYVSVTDKRAKSDVPRSAESTIDFVDRSTLPGEFDDAYSSGQAELRIEYG